MRYAKLRINDKIITDSQNIDKVLLINDMHWLIDSEIESADIEIKNKTLIWNDGIFYSSNWHFGIWKNGTFHAVWENGIWENGIFLGKWKSGIKK